MLEQIRQDAGGNTTHLGNKFEAIMKQFFKKDGEYASLFQMVKLWKEYSNERDTGIDLVAVDYHGKEWAIQCKCWDDDSYLGLKEVGTMFATAERYKIKNKIIVFTGADVSRELKKACEGTGTRIIRRSRLDNSLINWNKDSRKVKAHKPYKLREHQRKALQACMDGFRQYDRGKCIMACGTGKTLTALHIAEKQAGAGGLVLYLVPSISLAKQTLQEWSANRNVDHDYLIVCSDKTVGNEDSSTTDLSGYVTTDKAQIASLYEGMRARRDRMHVVFSTYQSADKVRDAFRGHVFDIMIFDEAHRTASISKRTGKGGIEDKKFTLAHHDANIKSKKRLYMTATPRIHKESDKLKARERDVVLYSMDDKKVFGELFYRLKFSDAIKLDVLTDYRVVVFEVSKEDMADIEAEQGDSEIALEESTKLSSVYRALLSQDGGKTENLLRRVIVFCNSIRASKNFSIGRFDGKHSRKRRSDDRASGGRFRQVVDMVNASLEKNVTVKTRHVDGTYNAKDRGDMLNWLKKEKGGNECRILSNAQCLSEGVDVPALDGVVFYEPRKSIIDVIQAVGRVMRKKEGKRFGYVVVPVVTTRDGGMETALETNKQSKIQLEVIGALRAHDDRIDRLYNHLTLARDQTNVDTDNEPPDIVIPPPLKHSYEALKPIILKKVGGFYFEDYGKRLGEVAADIERKIKSRMANRADKRYSMIVDNLYANLVGVVGETVTHDDAVQALAQHVVTKPVFDQLFQTDFNNSVANAFGAVVADLNFKEETEPLKEYQKDMSYQIQNITDERMRQVIIKKIYDNFFRGFDKKATTEHGIVYTPVEAVDYIIHSIQHVLEVEFGVGFDDPSVKVLDPFAGTGVFLARLLQSGLLGASLDEKYEKDLHMNELLLLAYYVANINIETTYYRMKKRHISYANACYVDTFTLDPEHLRRKRRGESVQEQSKIDRVFVPVLNRVRHQRMADITVIMGNPPWNVNRTTTHKKIEKRIMDTYGKYATTTMIRSLKNSYIKAMRYASDRIGDSGVIGFVVPATWLRGNTEAGFRAVLCKEFTDVWVFDMRGNQHGTKGDESRKEGGKIFGGGSRQPTAMVILVRNRSKAGSCTIHYHDIGDYLSREEKIANIRSLHSIKNAEWKIIEPNEDHDWLQQRNPETKKDYYKHCIPMGIRKGAKSELSIFAKFSRGIVSTRDPWVYNTSYGELVKNMKRTITHCANMDLDNPDTNPKYVAWGKTKSALKTALKRMRPKKPVFDKTNICIALYKPFIKQYLYLDDGVFTSVPYSIPTFFPNRNITYANCVPLPDPTQPNPTQPNPTQPNHIMRRQDQQAELLHHWHATGPPSHQERAGIPVQEGMNLAILVPDKIAEFTTFITSLPPDLETIHHNQTFPYRRA